MRKAVPFPRQLEHRIIRRDGEVRNIAVWRNIIRDADGRVVKRYGANQDITERVRVEEALRRQTKKILHMAYFDVLTDLPNRVHLNEWLNQEMERSPPAGIIGHASVY